MRGHKGNFPNSLLIQSFLLFLIFFVVALVTLPHYGINWDTINHLPRGQIFLHYFLTGKKDFLDLPKFKRYWQKEDTLFFSPDIPKNEIPRTSMYQYANVDFDYFLNEGAGHPPLSDIISTSFNLILFQKLGLINDIDSYRVHGVLIAAALVGLVYYWASSVGGKLAGFISAISLSLYPLFWSESHFNTEKDIPETVYWSFFVFSVWKAATKKSIKWMLVSGIFFGLALGTKFNILFSVFVILPWLIVYLFGMVPKKKIKLKKQIADNSKVILASVLALFIGLIMFFGTWPYLWPDPIGRIIKIFTFYKAVGLTKNVDPRFVGPLGINTYPLQWIIYTTPLVILILATIGFLDSVKQIKIEQRKTTFLFLLWFFVPIARVSWPGANIYGGVRQIMEYIPAMAILSGLGARYLYDFLKLKSLKIIFVCSLVVGFSLLTCRLYKIHPNENAYFNVLIGGLEGAKERDIPFWGNTFGAAYRKGVTWINENAEKDAKVTTARELLPNIPTIWFRRDITFRNEYRSAYLKEGEYTIALTYYHSENSSYFDRYLDQALIPVYEAKVDGIPVMKVWKNDKEHTIEKFLNESKISNYKIEKTDLGLRFDFRKVTPLSRIEADISSVSCNKNLKFSYVQISKDGEKWTRLPGTMPNEDWSVPRIGIQPEDDHITIPFVADEARFLDLVVEPSDSCLLNLKNTKVYIFEN